MAAPVISASSSILGYKRNEAFEFQPAATNSPVRWEAIGLPDGVTVDSHSEKSCTGAEATDTVTATAHGYANGDRVWFPSLTGGSGLTTSAIYHVRDKAADTFKVAATAGGAAVNFTTDISAGAVRKVSSGKISGSAATAGVYVVTLTATNTAGETSAAMQFVLGIASESVVATATGDAAADWTVDVVSRAVAATGGSGGSGGAAAVLATWKEGDVAMLALKFTKSGEVVDPDPATLKLTIKEMEPEGVLVEAEDFEKIGEGAAAYFNLPVDLSGAALAGALSNYEADEGTGFDALCELEWTLSVTHKSSPMTLRYSSLTFRVRIERDLGDN